MKRIQPKLIVRAQRERAYILFLVVSGVAAGKNLRKWRSVIGS